MARPLRRAKMKLKLLKLLLLTLSVGPKLRQSRLRREVVRKGERRRVKS